MEAPRSLQGPRRDLAGHLARGLRVCALTLAFLGPAAAPAGAAAGPGVSVSGPAGTSGFVGPQEIEAGSKSYEFILRATPGEAGQMTPRSGMPLRKVVEAAGVEFDLSGHVTIPRPNGTTAYLPARDFEEPSPVFEGGNPAIVSIDSASTRFLRPLITTEPNDVNATDNIATVSGEALAVGVHHGNVITVAVTSSSSSTTAGSPVQFSATASGGLAGEGFTYEWSFGDGTTATGESIPHAFSGSGTYQVRVTAVGSAESGGESGPVDIVVGNPPTTGTPGATTTPEPQATKPSGAPGKGGREGRGGKGPKPSSGGEKGKHGNDSSTQRGKSPSGRSHPRGSAEPSAPATGTPPPEAPAAVPLPGPAETSGGDAAGPPGCCSAASPAAASPEPTPQPAEPTPSSGELVEGRLVGDDLGPVSVAEASSPGQGSRSAAAAVGGGGVSVPVVALMVVGLLAGGALFEWRRGRPIR